jgi:hypothetical protein
MIDEWSATGGEEERNGPKLHNQMVEAEAMLRADIGKV